MKSKKQQRIQKIWQNANVHKRASTVGIPVEHQDNQICDCCDQIVEKEQLSMWEHTKQLEVFGFGYPLWYSFLKYCILLVIVLIATSTASELYMATHQNYQFCYEGKSDPPHVESADEHADPKPHSDNKPHADPKPHASPDHEQPGSHGGHGQHMSSSHYLESPTYYQHLRSSQSHQFYQLHSQQRYTNMQHQAHQPTPQHPAHPPGHHPVECTSFMVYFSIFRGEGMFDNQFLKTIQFLIHLVTLIYIRNMILKQEQYYDQRTTSISDYSIIVSNLPQKYGVRAMIARMFEKEYGKVFKEGSKSASIKQMIYVFEDDEINKLTAQRKQLKKQLLEAHKKQDEQEEKHIQDSLEENEKSLEKEAKRVRKQMDRDYIKCDKVIVVFNTENDKAQVMQQYEEDKENGRTYSQYFENAKNIKLKEAPEPNQIIWEHIDESDTKRSRLIIQGWLLTFLFLAIVAIIFYFILLAKTKLFLDALQMEHDNPNDPTAHNFKIFATTIVFVAIFGVLMFNKFVMGKVLHIFVHMEKHAYTDKQNHSFSLKYALGMFFTTALMTLAVQAITFGNFYAHQYGVIEQETIMFIVSAFFIPLVWVINPYNLMKQAQCRKHHNTLVSQKMANDLIQPFPYDLGKRYAQILEIMWFTFLYSELIPLGSFLVLIGLVLYYWIDKYNFLNRSTLKAGLSGKMAILGLKSLDATLFLSPAGGMLFDWLVRKRFDYLSLVFTLLGLAYMLVPITKLIWMFNGEKFLLQDKPYSQTRQFFRQNYVNLHPVYQQTHKKQIKQHKDLVHKHYRQQLQVSKIYGAGRGMYMKDTSQQNSRLSKSNASNSQKG